MAHDTVDRASGKQSGFLADIVAPNRTNEPRRKMWSKQEDEVLMAETTTRCMFWSLYCPCSTDAEYLKSPKAVFETGKRSLIDYLEEPIKTAVNDG